MKNRSLSRPMKRVATQLYRFLNTPRSLACELLMQAGEWDQLVTLSIDPTAYLDTLSGADKLRRDVQATDFLRKNVDVPSSFDRKKAALLSFQRSENECKATNYFLECIEIGLGDSDPFIGRVKDIVSKTRKIISRILGKLPDSLHGRFGPGTSFELEGSVYSTLADKLYITPHVTPAAKAVWEHTYDGTIMDRRRMELGLPHSAPARGNRFTSVDKDGLTNRGICIEPLGNLYCQLGVGSFVKGRLARVGLYVDRSGNRSRDPIKRLRYRPRPNGQAIHQCLAAMASLDGLWATIDLSSASDTIAYRLVKALLPPDWFQLLDALRSPFTRMPNGTWVKLEKFSSMGNGFTFELETLLFAGLSAAVADLVPGEDLFVYGDDILVPTQTARDVLAVLKTFGFTPNPKKTFISGPFRESCGGDFFDGWNVRAYQSTSEPATPLEWIAMHNRLGGKFPSCRSVLRTIVEQIPMRYRVFGPSRAGDSVLHSRKATSYTRPPDKGDGIDWITGLEAVPVKVPLDRWGDEFVVCLALLGVASDGLRPKGQEYGLGHVSLSIS